MASKLPHYDPIGVVYTAGPMTGIEGFNYAAFHVAEDRLTDAGYKVLNPARNHKGRTDLPYGTYIRTALRQVFRADAVVVLDGWEGSKGARLEVLTAHTLNIPVYMLESVLSATFDPIAHRFPDPVININGNHYDGWAAKVEVVAVDEVHRFAATGKLDPVHGTPSSECDSGTCDCAEPAIIEPVRGTTLDAAKAAVLGDRNRDYGGPLENFTETAALLTAAGFYRDGGPGPCDDQSIAAADVAVIMTLVKIARLHNTPNHRDSWVDLAGYAACGAEVADREASS